LSRDEHGDKHGDKPAMNPEPHPSALIAEDEPLLAADLQAQLANVWPELRVVATAANGEQAVEQALALRPDIVLLDIRMPAMDGLDAAEALTEDWSAGTPLPLIVFVTAYEEHALKAFERAAIDYVLKPVSVPRLEMSCERLRSALQLRSAAATPLPPALAHLLAQLRGNTGTAAASPEPPLSVLQASIGTTIHMVPVGEVLYFEAADKYVRVITAAREYLIRSPLRQLLPRLDPLRFWQVHRSVVVRADAIATASRDDSGKVELTLHGHPQRLVASRLYAHRFKAM
jgi:DNA-binding LytR/AlgR family response regulator